MQKETGVLPREFVSRLRYIYPQQYEAILETFHNKKTPTFRANFLKTDLLSLKGYLKKERVRYKEIAFPPGAFLLLSDFRRFQMTRIYQEGLVYVQNISSMVVPLLLEAKRGECLLDLCAAPGAKTTQLASLAPEAEIVAIEKVRKRYYKLLSNIKLQGAKNVKPFLYDGTWVRKKFPEYFDKILLDAPCSAEGRFFVYNPRTFKYWSQRKIKEMFHKQKQLLHAAFYALKEGGVLVYATCTFSPEENEAVIDWFLKKFKERVELLPLTLPFENICDGLRRWHNKKFSSSLRVTKRILPTQTMEGFFMAKIKKVGY